MSRWSTPGEIRILEVPFSVFRVIKDSTCLRGYFNENPWDIVKVLHRERFLCYAISREAAYYLDTVLLEAGFDEEFVSKWVRLEVGLTCWRTGSSSVIQAVICSGPNTEERMPFRVVSVAPSYRGVTMETFYLVPPCVAFAIFGPLIYDKRWRVDQSTLRLRAPKPGKLPVRTEEFIAELAGLRGGLNQEGVEALSGIEAAVLEYVETMEAIERQRIQVHESLEAYEHFRKAHEELELPWFRTTAKVLAIRICGKDRAGEDYYLGRP